MNGTVVVGGGGGGSAPSVTAPPPSATAPPPSTGPAPGTGDTVEVTAQGIKFDTAEIVLAAGQATTIHFMNNDAGVQHNIVIATDETLSETLFSGDLVTGVGEATYEIPPLEAGTYYFQCAIHPSMNGVVTVR